MCGIAGIALQDASRSIDPAILLRMSEALVHRGPDGFGTYIQPGIALASRRLAIQDLSERGQMPMSTPDGRYWITYNGEVYNFQELRQELKAAGCQFRSDTDTEVVLHLYARLGPAALDKLNGMFAFAVWDSRERTVFAARDRLGIKPLYYSLVGGDFRFASEHKALWAANVPVEFNHEVWEELLCFRFVAGEGSAYRGIQRLLPGHYLTFRNGQLKIVRWWRLDERSAAAADSLRKTPADFRQLFDDAVRLRCISDVPVGVLLSGGLDSGNLAASLAASAGGNVRTFTVRFSEKGYDEGAAVAAIARKWQLERHEIEVQQRDVIGLLETAVRLNDEPLAHGSDAHLYAISKFARPLVTVLLSGEGADETMCGYVRYRALLHPRLLQLLRSWYPAVSQQIPFANRATKLGRLLSSGDADAPILYNSSDIFPDELEQVGITPKRRFVFRESVLQEAKKYHPEPLRQAMYLDQHTFLTSVLDRNDRMTMGASIECRVPYLDYRIVELMAATPTHDLVGTTKGKLPVRRNFNDRLPQEVLRQKKWGFGIPWLSYAKQSGEFMDLLEALSRSHLLQDSPIERHHVSKLLARFRSGDEGVFPILFQLLMIDMSWKSARACTTPVSATSV